MKKSDLKQNMIVITRNGDRFLVLEKVETQYGYQDLLFISGYTYLLGDDYNDDLTNRRLDLTDFDIVEILRWHEFRGLTNVNTAKDEEFTVLAERSYKAKWQPWELQVLSHLSYSYNKIRKGEDSKIYLWKEREGSTSALELNLPSLWDKAVTTCWLDIDGELERYGMKREKTKGEAK